MKKVVALLLSMALLPLGICVNADSTGLAEKEDVRIVENFNRDWLFAYGEIEGAEAKVLSEEGWCDIALPHSFSIPYDLNDSKFYVGVGWYRKEFDVPADWSEKFVTIDFEGVFQRTDIYINGVKVPRSKVYGFENVTDSSIPTHEGGYNAFSVDNH